MVLAGPARTPVRRLVRGAGAAVAAALLVGLTAAPAAADVTVVSADANQGGYARITFRVPTQSRTASTTGLRVVFPPHLPVLSVSAEPKAGWTPSVRMRILATPLRTATGRTSEIAGDVSWTVNLVGVGLKPGEFEEFSVLAGPLPGAAALPFAAIQTYSDGTTATWGTPPPGEGTAQPGHPAPVLRLGPPAAAQVRSAATPAPATSSSTVAGAYAIAALALLTGATAIAVARRRPTPDA